MRGGGGRELDENELRTLAAIVHKASPTDEQIATLRTCLAPSESHTRTEKSKDGEVKITEVGSTGALRVSRRLCSRVLLSLAQVLTPRITLDRLLACDVAKTGLSKNARFPRT